MYTIIESNLEQNNAESGMKIEPQLRSTTKHQSVAIATGKPTNFSLNLQTMVHFHSIHLSSTIYSPAGLSISVRAGVWPGRSSMASSGGGVLPLSASMGSQVT